MDYRFCYLITAGLFLAVWGFSQPERRVLHGRVIDADIGAPLVGAVVFESAYLSAGVVTDEQGQFMLPIMSNDSVVRLTASYLGYERLEWSLPWPPDNFVQVSLKATFGNLPSVLVRGERLIAETFRAQKIEKLDIYTNPIAKADPLLAVNTMPAATTTDESAAISLRGSSPTATAIFFNEVPIYDGGRFAQLNGIGTFSIFNTNLIDNVQVFPSNPPLEFGNTAAGLIAIQTEELVPSQSLVSLSVTMAGVGGQLLLPVGERSGLTLFSNYQPSYLLRKANPRAQLPSFSSGDGGVYWFYQPDSVTVIKLFNYSLIESYAVPFEHPSASFLFEQQRHRNFTVANYRRLFRLAALSINAGLNLDRFQFQGGNIQWLNRQFDYYFAVHYQRYGPKWSYKMGLSFDQRRSQSEGQFPLLSYALAAIHPNLPFAQVRTAPVHEAYTFGRYTLHKHWELGVGLRKNLPSLTEQNYWSGQCNMQWRPASAHRFVFSVGQYHRLNLLDMGNDQNWIESRQVVLDWQWRRSRWEWQTAAFQKWERVGTQQTTIRGAEAFGALRIPAKLETTLSLTVIDASVREGVEVFPAPFDMDYFVKWGLDYRFGIGWNVAASFLWRQGIYFQPVTESRFDSQWAVYEPIFAARANQQRLPDYKILNLSASRQISLSDRSNLILFANCNNLLDRRNARNVTYNHDYSISNYDWFSRRIIFVGGVFNFL